MKKLEKISEPWMKGWFTKELKKQMREWLNSYGRISDNRGFYLYNDGFSYCVDWGVLPNKGVGGGYVVGSNPFKKGGITVENFMYGNGFELGKSTSDRNLIKVAHRIIEYYNEHIEYYNDK